MTRYAKAINEELHNVLLQEDPFVLFGQNVSAGSCLSGLTRGLSTTQGLEMFNTPNCENAMVGFGFGLMMKGVDSAFFVKQHDFLLLTLDHMVNTYNIVKLSTPQAAFTIVCIVVDSGFEGPQSRLNNLSDFCSLADIDTFTINSQQDVEVLIPMMKEPGFRIVALSQRLFRGEIMNVLAHQSLSEHVVQYGRNTKVERTDVAIISMNFALSQAMMLADSLEERGKKATVVHFRTVLPKDFTMLNESLSSASLVVVLDDSRSINKSSDRLKLHVMEYFPNCKVYTQTRSASVSQIPPNADSFHVDVEAVCTVLNG